MATAAAATAAPTPTAPAAANKGSKMFDLKMCLLDFMRISSNSPKPRKSLKEISNRYSSHYMQKYNDVNIIYFNENMSMTSKSNTIKFARCPTGNFKPSPLNNSFSNRKKSIREFGIETAYYDFSSDDRTTTTSTTNSPASESSNRETETDDCLCEYSDCAVTNGLDSFCTLCTSSFSFNQCNRCEKSTCSSKCDNSVNGSEKNKLLPASSSSSDESNERR